MEIKSSAWYYYNLCDKTLGLAERVEKPLANLNSCDLPVQNPNVCFWTLFKYLQCSWEETHECIGRKVSRD